MQPVHVKGHLQKTTCDDNGIEMDLDICWISGLKESEQSNHQQKPIWETRSNKINFNSLYYPNIFSCHVLNINKSNYQALSKMKISIFII